MRILILEDELHLLRLYSKILSSQGHYPHIAATHHTARQLLRMYSFDLAICDVRLGDLSGIDIIQDLFHKDFPDVPVVVISGHHQYEDKARALGVPFYLKPIDRDALLDVIHRYGRDNTDRSGNPGSHSNESVDGDSLHASY